MRALPLISFVLCLLLSNEVDICKGAVISDTGNSTSIGMSDEVNYKSEKYAGEVLLLYIYNIDIYLCNLSGHYIAVYGMIIAIILSYRMTICVASPML